MFLENGSNLQPSNLNKPSGFIGGPKVHFGVDDVEKEEGLISGDKTQQFERKNTPHPKPSSSSASTSKHHKKQHVDGHVAPKVEEVIFRIS